jgi:hypothetical protein
MARTYNLEELKSILERDVLPGVPLRIDPDCPEDEILLVKTSPSSPYARRRQIERELSAQFAMRDDLWIEDSEFKRLIADDIAETEKRFRREMNYDTSPVFYIDDIDSTIEAISDSRFFEDIKELA